MGALKLAYYTEIETAQKTWTVYKKGAPEKFYTLQKSELDYYPYGMLMPDRHTSTSVYRYGFQGQEKDDEIKGEGNSLNYKYRMHDTRLGRFFAVDPLTSKYPHNSPYAFSENRVTNSVELEGLEAQDGPMSVGVSFNFKLSFGEKSSVYYNIGTTVSSQISTPSITKLDLSASFKLDASFNVFNGGIGTPDGSKNVFWDQSTIGSVTIGGGTTYGMPQYPLNYNTRSGIHNYKKLSLTMGNGYNYNSSLGVLNSQASFGVRVLPFSFSSNNDGKDTPFFAFGPPTDYGHTGSLLFSLKTKNGPLIEGGYQSFTGLNIQGDYTMVNGEKIRRQGTYGQTLNKATYFFRYGGGLNSPMVQFDLYNNGGFQRWIHDNVSHTSEYFNYNNIGNFEKSIFLPYTTSILGGE